MKLTKNDPDHKCLEKFLINRCNNDDCKYLFNIFWEIGDLIVIFQWPIHLLFLPKLFPYRFSPGH